MRGSGFRRPTSEEKTATSRRSASPIRTRSRWSSSGGSKAFETSPSFSPLPRRLSRSACVESPIARAGDQASCSASRKRCELLVRELDVEACEELADQARILDLLDGAGNEEERQVALAETGCSILVVRQVVAARRPEPRLPARLEQLLVVDEVEERVPPVEKHRVEIHGANCRLSGR